MPRSPNRPIAALRFIVAATGLFAATASLRPADAQSFDCREARYRDELLICERPGLAQLDQQLATLYRQKIGNIAKERQDEFQQHEAYFLRARRECREDSRCIEQSYRNRIQELENFASEEERERSSDATLSADRPSERPTRPREPRSSRSERPFEPSGSTNAAVPQTPQPEFRSHESAATGEAMNPVWQSEPQSTERSDKSRKVTRPVEQRVKPSHATAAAPAAVPPSSGTAAAATAPAPQPPAAPSGPNAEHVATSRPSPANDVAAKPTIQWVDPAPAR